MAQNKSSKPTIFVFGNPLLPQDSTPLKLLPILKKQFPRLQFTVSDPTEDFDPPIGNWYLLDTVVGIKKPVILKGIKDIVTQKRYSLHDYDLAIHLKLLDKLGKLKRTNVIIIAVPMGKEKKEVSKAVCRLFQQILLKASRMP